jgi:hypothetical protein
MYILDFFISSEINFQSKSILPFLEHSVCLTLHPPDLCSLSCTKTKLSDSSDSSAFTKKRTYHKTTLKQTKMEKYWATRQSNLGLCGCLDVEFLGILRVALSSRCPFSRFALLSSITRFQLKSDKISEQLPLVGGDQFPFRTLALKLLKTLPDGGRPLQAHYLSRIIITPWL